MRADRLLSMMILLQTKGRLTAQVLANELGVSERTIYRDIDALSAAGIPVYCERGPGGGCALLESYRTNLTGLTRDEVRALFMLSIPAPLEQLGVDQDLRTALLKLSASLPALMQPESTRVGTRIHLDPLPWEPQEKPSPHLETMQLALWADRCLEITYRLAFDAQVKHIVEPFGLVAKANQWYLVCSMQDAIFVIPAQNVLRADLQDQTFALPGDFNLVEFWTAWVSQQENNQPRFPVQVRISTRLLEMLELFKDPLLAGVTSKSKADEMGWVELTFQFRTFENARQRLLNFGGAVEILAPPALRESVRDFARQTLSVYES